MQHIPRSEFIKRRAYWQLWRKANSPEGETHQTSIPGVTQEFFGERIEDDATVMGE